MITERKIVLDPIQRVLGRTSRTAGISTPVRWELERGDYIEANWDEESRCLSIRLSDGHIFTHGTCSNQIEVYYKTPWELHQERTGR